MQQHQEWLHNLEARRTVRAIHLRSSRRRHLRAYLYRLQPLRTCDGAPSTGLHPRSDYSAHRQRRTRPDTNQIEGARRSVPTMSANQPKQASHWRSDAVPGPDQETGSILLQEPRSFSWVSSAYSFLRELSLRGGDGAETNRLPPPGRGIPQHVERPTISSLGFDLSLPF